MIPLSDRAPPTQQARPPGYMPLAPDSELQQTLKCFIGKHPPDSLQTECARPTGSAPLHRPAEDAVLLNRVAHQISGPFVGSAPPLGPLSCLLPVPLPVLLPD